MTEQQPDGSGAPLSPPPSSPIIKEQLPPEPLPVGRYAMWAGLVMITVLGVLFYSMPTGDEFNLPAGMGPAVHPLLGKHCPAVEVTGWLGDKAVTTEDLAGRVVVIDVWAYWCGPCAAITPALQKLADEYRDRGVVMLGLTSEDRDALTQSERYHHDLQITWPSGIGAADTSAALMAESIPAIFVVDRQGMIVWTRFSREPIRAAINRALEQPTAAGLDGGIRVRTKKPR